MGLLLFLSRRHSIISDQNRIEYRITQLSKKLQDLQQYSANIANGSISMSDMMNVPGSMFGRQMMFMQYAHNSSVQGAQNQYAQMQPIIQQQMMQMQSNPQYQQAYQQMIFQNLYKQQREVVAKQEEKLLNQQEKDITQEKTKLEMQLKLIQQEYESLKQAEDKAVERLKPNYVG